LELELERTLDNDLTRNIQISLEKFLLASIHGGLAHSWSPEESKWIKPYPEVTGYLLSYFSTNAILKVDLRESVECLLNRQLDDGSWPSFYGDLENGFTFDTVQILNGLMSQNWVNSKRVDESIAKGLDFLSNRMRFGFPLSRSRETVSMIEVFNKKNWAHGITPINFKTAELLPLLENNPEIFHTKITKKIRSLQKFIHALPQLSESHPGAYQLEGLFALGNKALVEKRLEKYFKPDTNGFLPAHPGADYAYNSGSVQIAILWAKCGHIETATKMFYRILEDFQQCERDWLCFPQFSGPSKPHAEYSTWGVKYFCELLGILGHNENAK
jgi:hypothetical protein